MFIKKITTFAVFLSVLTLVTTGLYYAPNANAQQSPNSLKLPPSLERELRLRGGNAPRVVRFSDTVKADKLISASLRDSSGRELDSTMVRDSAIVTVDSVVSLSHKEWLDSMLAELPETQRTSDGLRFHYPYTMMVNTSRKQVPFDSSLPMRMDPVSKEDLSLFDPLPIQQPIIPAKRKRYNATLLLGTPGLPEITARALLLNSSHTTLELGGSFSKFNPEVTSIPQAWNIQAHGIFSFPISSSDPHAVIPLIEANISSESLTRALIATKGNSVSSILSRNIADATFSFGSMSAIYVSGNAMLRYFSDNSIVGLTERSGTVKTNITHQETDSSSRFSFSIGYSGASTTTDKLHLNAPLGALTLEGLLSSGRSSSFSWEAGLTFITASDRANTSYIFPKIKLQKVISSDINLFLLLDRCATTQTFDHIYNINPFYSPVLFNVGKSTDSLLAQDLRRVSIDRYRISLGTEFFVSSDDRISLLIRYADRHNENAFYSVTDSGGIQRYYVKPIDVKVFSVELATSLLFFKNDCLTLSSRFVSTQSVDSSAQLPYEPTLLLDASYRFGSISRQLFPSVGCKYISREQKNLFFLNAGADYQLDNIWKIKASITNLLGTDGSFWDPYIEYPRRIEIGATASF